MKFSQLTRAIVACFLFVPAGSALMAFQLTGQSWPSGTTVTMQLELGSTNVSLIDGLGTWNNSAADALGLWNLHLEQMKFAWVLNSTAPKDSLDGYNSVFFSDTILGEGFGDDTLAATIVWYNTSDYTTAIESDVVFNIAQTFNSYRGVLIPGEFDFHRVALHEFGHVLGLAHVYNDPVGQALMEPIISNLDHLAADDIAGAVELYGYRITTPSELTGFVVGQVTSFAFQANNNPTSFSVVGLPQGLVMDPITGEVTGIPLESGTFQVTVTAHGSPRDVSAVITIEIGAASIFSTISPDTISVGSFFTCTILAGNNPISFTATGLPVGVVIDEKSGIISGIADLSGGFDVAVVAHGADYDASGIIHFTILPAYRQPVTQISLAGNVIRSIPDPVRHRLYVLDDRNVNVVDTDLLSIVATFPVTFAGYDLCLSPDNTQLWFTDAVDIHSYSLTDFSSLPAIPNGPFYFRQIRAGLGGKLYVTNPPGGAEYGIYEIDVSTGTVTPVELEVGGAEIDASPDGKYLYATLAKENVGPIIQRYDISSGTPNLLRTFTPPLATYVTELKLSPDGKLLSYKLTGEYANQTIFFIANTLQGATTVVDPTAIPGYFNFGSSSSVGYLDYISQSQFQNPRLDFLSTASGLPFNKWELERGGAAYADYSGTNLFVTAYGSVDVYSLASDATGGVEPGPKSLLNVSTRSTVGVDDQRMIGGFIISGDESKEIAFRALGPSLPIIGAMTNPKISIYDSAGTLVTSNQNWNQYREQIVNAGLAPFDEHDAGLVATLAPGAYTAVVESEEESTGGIGLVELYDLSSNNSGRIANISTRSKVGTGDNVMIGGFIVGGGEATDVLARAIGPSLANTLTGVLLDPILELYDSNGVQIASNDNWRSDQQSEIAATGIPPTDNRESAVLALLEPGPYTAIVRGKDSTTGIALVEIYNLDAASAGGARSFAK